jgi:alkylation response protein AidB-like acyl-CoA dehydrogenase
MSDQIDLGDARLLQTTAREVFTELFGSQRLRELMATPSGWDRRSWQRLTGELGVAGLMVDESLGGSGLTARELGLIFEEAGRCLGGGPMFAVAGLAIPLLLFSGDTDACKRWLPPLCDGSLIATVIYADSDGRWGPSQVDIRAEDDRLFGRSGYVIDAAASELILTPARTPEGPAIFAVETRTDGVEVTPLVTLDQTRKQARVEFTGAQGVRLQSAAAEDGLERAYALSCALLACELCGVAARCLELTADYARERVQFGRPIGSFQAIKQKLADLLIQVESARSAATAAVGAAATNSPDLWWTASLAKSYCADAAMHASSETIQIHGGIGFTWEHDAHLYFKRARTGQELLGSVDSHYERVGTHLSSI